MNNVMRIALVVLGAGALWSGLNYQPDDQPTPAVVVENAASDNNPSAGISQGVVNTPVEVTLRNNEPHQTPDFDGRKQPKIIAKPVEQDSRSSAELNQTIAAKEAKLASLIKDYNASLDDPLAKEKFERAFKNESEAYKKALLAKVKRGEL